MIVAYISTALKQLAQNKGRSALTMLGIIIGIGSVIYIMTIGQVAKNFLLAQITQFGTNVVEVAPTSFFQGESDFEFTDDDVEAVQTSPLLPELSSIAAGTTIQKTLEYDGESYTTSVYGDGIGFFTVNNVDILQGRMFTESEVNNGSNVVIIPENTASDIFGTVSPIGKRVSIDGTTFTVIGVMEEFSAGFGIDLKIAVAPLLAVRNAFVSADKSSTVDYMLVEFTDGTNAQSFQNRLRFVIRDVHGLDDSEDDPFIMIGRDSALQTLDTVLIGIQAFVSAVAAISLLVGGIGIMNIMLVTVKERTKEIGLRKAIGAKNSSVLAQFLIESVVLTTVGGICGAAMGLGLSLASVWAIGAFAPEWGVEFVFVPSAVVIAVGVSVTVGMIFGLYPALKASKLHPIEALRYE